jgi:hypothetical protein
MPGGGVGRGWWQAGNCKRKRKRKRKWKRKRKMRGDIECSFHRALTLNTKIIFVNYV